MSCALQVDRLARYYDTIAVGLAVLEGSGKQLMFPSRMLRV